MLSSSISQSIYLLVPLYQIVSAQSSGYAYSLQDSYEGASFFDGFNFFTGVDPTNGFVTYIDKPTAQQNGLISTNSSTIYLGVDYTSVLNPSGAGRQSVRLESTTIYSEGLFIGDFAHMPGGICGVWPAWWTYGADWPNSGEIDIIENANAATTNLMSLHTNAQCTIAGNDETGTLITNDCNQYSALQSGSGCGVANKNTNSYGAGFNANGGGVYAMEWTNSSIKGWFFPRGSIPADIGAGNPRPSTWGTPFSNFQGSCDIPSHFFNHKMVFDTTFCGDWAGAVFGIDPVCSTLAKSCRDYVATNPAAFANAYWAINSVKVYKQGTNLNAGNPGVSALPIASSLQFVGSSTISLGSSSPTLSGTSSSIVYSTSLSSLTIGQASTSTSSHQATSYTDQSTSPRIQTKSLAAVQSSVLPVLSSRPLSVTPVPAGQTSAPPSGVSAAFTSSPIAISQIPATANSSALIVTATVTSIQSTPAIVETTVFATYYTTVNYPAGATVLQTVPSVAYTTVFNTYYTTVDVPVVTVYYTPPDRASVSPATTTCTVPTAAPTTYKVATTACHVRVQQIGDGQIQAPQTVCVVDTVPLVSARGVSTLLTSWNARARSRSSSCPLEPSLETTSATSSGRWRRRSPRRKP